MGVELRILELPKKARGYRFHDVTIERMEKLGQRLPTKSDTEIIEDAITHLLGQLERDLPVNLTIPSEAGRRHKRTPPRDAA